MGKYNGAVITTAGANVISQAISGTELTWTVMRSSSVAIPAGTDIAALTSLTGIEQTAAITDASVYGNSTIQVSARFSNTGVSTAYLLETIGIYGQLAGGAETLIAVMTAVTPDQMPVYDADSPSAFIYNSQITVQDAETVVMTVNDSGTATVADLNRKVNLNGGDLSDTVVETFTAAAAEYPVPAAGDTGAILWGKVVKWFSDMAALVATKLNAANVVNNLTTTASGYALDARQGKTLNDLINSMAVIVTETSVEVDITQELNAGGGKAWIALGGSAIVPTVPSGYTFAGNVNVTVNNVSAVYATFDGPNQYNSRSVNPYITNASPNVLSSGTRLNVRLYSLCYRK